MNNTYCAIWLWVQRKTVIVSGNKSLPVWIKKHCNIYRIMYELTWITMFGHEWGDLPMCENHWQIASRVGKKSLVTVTNVFFLFLTHCLMSWIHNSARTTIGCSFRHYCEGRSFLDVTWPQCSGIVTSYSSIVVARANFAERRSSPVNNIREYQLLTTQYSRLSV